jgi:AAA+ ATPase superfamily predicted ATPase
MANLSPLIKGLITGIAMLIATIVLAYTNQSAEGGSAYIVYGLYAAGIVWTLRDYSRSANYKNTFGAIFGQGFRCFIIITLIMVIFSGVYSKMHPEMAEQSSQLYKQELEKKKNKTPAEIDTEVAGYREHFTTSFISTAIFGYLVIGVFFTAAGAAFLLIRRK